MKSPTRPRLSADVILQLAVGTADREGLAAVSMRRIAGELSVTPMALYRHFEDKARLLDAMAERLIEGGDLEQVPDTRWEVRLRSVLDALMSLLRGHPWMAGVVIERLVPLPNYLQALEVMLDCTREAGLDPESGAVVVQHAVQAVAAVVEHAPRARRGGAAAEESAHLAALLADLEPEKFPRVRESAAALTEPPDLDMYYRCGLDLVIGGVGAVADAAGRT